MIIIINYLQEKTNFMFILVIIKSLFMMIFSSYNLNLIILLLFEDLSDLIFCISISFLKGKKLLS
jgi:hypothetical protein